MLNGLINVYKEPGFTSFDVVAVMRGITGQRKIGHTGTLDPSARGVLPICLGNATKLCDMLNDKKKEYVATFMLGKSTDTLDDSGTVLEEREVKATPEDIKEAAKSFVGGYEQLPPMYSAKWVDGKRLYELARQGIEVQRKPVFVDIYEIEILDISLPVVKMKVLCGKGTYIRSLCVDIAAKCNELAVMTDLERTATGMFDLTTARTLDELTKLKNEGKLSDCVIKTDYVFKDIPALTVRSEYRKVIDNGNKLYPKMITSGVPFPAMKRVRVYNDEGTFMGIYERVNGENALKPEKMFLESN